VIGGIMPIFVEREERVVCLREDERSQDIAEGGHRTEGWEDNA
jgi:hypothetical protein